MSGHSHDGDTQDPQPAIFSETYPLEFLKSVTSERIQQALTLWVGEVRDWANHNAYLVGHIKIFVEGQEKLWLSSTGKSINIKHSQGWLEYYAAKVTLSVTAIIFGPTKTVLEEAALDRLKDSLKNITISLDGCAKGPSYNLKMLLK